jgi:hypothetical protein
LPACFKATYAQPMHPLVDLARRASAPPTCWNIFCTTCGATELRGGIWLLARGDRLDQTPWPVRHPSYDSPPLTVAEAGRLTRVCVSAPLDQVARAASFPDWLGYLGMILWELREFKEHRLRIGAVWSLQFIGLGGDPATWTPFWRHPLGWRDLGTAERQRLGDFATGRPADEGE